MAETVVLRVAMSIEGCVGAVTRVFTKMEGGQTSIRYFILFPYSGKWITFVVILFTLPEKEIKELWFALLIKNTSTRVYVRNHRKFAYPKFVKLQRTTIMSGNISMKSSYSSIRHESSIKAEHTVGEKDGVIIVDHGSRRQESNLMLNEYVAMFKARTGYRIVEPAHMELAEPSIRDAFRQCVQQGANRVIVSPFFLFPGRHWQQDIPSLAAEASREHPGISYIITAPLGLHGLMVDVMNDRIKHCLSHVAGVADECSVCAGTGKCRLYGKQLEEDKG